MAGRGRGRSYSFDTGALGFGKGDAIPAAILQPPPLFPPLEFKPSPLRNTEADEYLLALKQEFRAGMKDSLYFVKTSVKSKDIARYSDKYKTSQSNGAGFIIENALLPKELQKRLKRTKLKAVTPAIVIKKKRPKNDKLNIDEEESTTLEVLEKVIEEKVVADDEDVQEGDEIEEEEEYYEEDEEEDNDYLVNHYDEGDDEFGMGDDDDGDEGPVY
ncbi:DNA-directed RNA polymerase III subunit RPC7-like [Rhopilema esculentum]|uniref:DNA-directed RNA polymerase III subunit RPC7-like n=1 Tax=Rhopilema esculentum TaxID=499914 RepID=UPI0031D5C450